MVRNRRLKIRKGGGKPKGSGYEREVGEKISLWLSHGEHKHLLCRTTGSGAQFTTHAKKNIQAGQAGDLMAQDPLAFNFCSRFVIECKSWKNLEIIKFLERIGGKDTLYEALVKVKREGESVNKLWMLAAKQNWRRDLLFMPVKAFPENWLLPNSHPTLEWHTLFTNTVYMFYQNEFFKEVQSDWFVSKQRELIPQR